MWPHNIELVLSLIQGGVSILGLGWPYLGGSCSSISLLSGSKSVAHEDLGILLQREEDILILNLKSSMVVGAPGNASRIWMSIEVHFKLRRLIRVWI